MRRKIRDSPMR